ncbi:hypothetical protein V6N13_026067 [Hibiscus sabdariffa]|uniref:Uncharacterized protein n=2 Tax=Hibiscus sabdariffa TaxID=183260 RepID=A0ABR1ZC16_9ROSI
MNHLISSQNVEKKLIKKEILRHPLVCGGCHTLLMYNRGATSVQCSCCHTVNMALEANQVAHVNCGNCRMLLLYQYGARSVKCAIRNFVTSVGGSESAAEQKCNS